MVVLIVTLALKHFTNPKGILSTASILIGILVRLRGSYYYDHGSAAYRNGGS